jgi:tRNA A-37 threonylcarbamoyl transferase component Bud32
MGIVYEAEHLLLRRRVAIKCLHAQFAASPHSVKRFHNEALAASSIGHPNIIEVPDMGRFSDGTFYMVLEYLEGRDLAQLIDHEGPQPIGRVVKILSQVCDALGVAHAKGIVHRDLKPENIFLVRREGDPYFPKVVDFGVAKFKEAEDHKLTRTGSALGTPYYMSPEQISGKREIDERTDVYALGVILFQALTATYPIQAESYPLLVVKICQESPPLLHELRSDVPPELSAIVARMLAKSPADRFASANEVRAALAPFHHLNTAPPAILHPEATRGMHTGVLGVAFAAGPSTGANGVASTGALGPMTRDSQADTRPDGPGRASFAADPRAASVSAGSKLPLIVALGAVLLAIVVVVAFVALSLREQPAPIVRTIAPPPPPPEAPRVVTVHLSIETVPAGAELFLDGERVANPFEAEVPQGDDSHLLEARLEGHREVVQHVRFRYAQRMRLELQRLPEPTAPVVSATRTVQPAPTAEPPPSVPRAPEPVYAPRAPEPTAPPIGLKRVRF